MNKFIEDIWKILNGFNLSTIYLFFTNENRLIYDFTPTLTHKPYTFALINFNFNINKVIENLKIALELDNQKHPYYIMCDNALVLLVTAFETYLTSNYNNIRNILGKNKINPIILTFQRKETLKEKYNEVGVDIAHLNENLWREIFSSSENEKGIIKLRNIIVHNGWKGFEKKSDMLDHIKVKESLLIICNFINIVEKTLIKQYPNLKNNQEYKLF